MPAVYEKMGIRFRYPENWSLDESEIQEENATVALYGPGTATWCLTLHTGSQDPQAMSQQTLETMQGEYDELDVEQATYHIAGQDTTGYAMNFICLDLTATAVVHSFRVGETTFSIFWQAEDREYEKFGRVFEAIAASLEV